MAKTLKELFPRKQKLYGCNAIRDLVHKYIENDGDYRTIEEGCLGWGKLILFGDGLKTTIVTEVYVNTQTSGHTVRMYEKCPKCYEQYIC